MSIIDYPFSGGEILRKKKSIRRRLLEQDNLLEKRIAILSGSTVGDIRDVLEIFLLNFGIKPRFYIGQYDRFYEDIMFENRELADFKPELAYIHTSARNLIDGAFMSKLREVWAKLKNDFSCSVIQNNFELPLYGASDEGRKINELNIQIDDYAKNNIGFYVNDIQNLSARFGLDDWFSEQDYFLYKYACSVSAIPTLCHNIAKIIKSMYGKNQKCVALDLDNTLWGGVIGEAEFSCEAGQAGIELGMETAVGEAYTAFQRYIKALHDRGIILAVCSKNDERTAENAFRHPGMVLRLEDIAVFRANWESKAENILAIAERLNILPESIVFVDDNPAERELVRQALPEVKVPEAASPLDFIRYIEGAGYFFSAGVSADDKKRNEYYAADAKRGEARSAFHDYGEYLRSLQMKSAVQPFASAHLDRITQLINKTNQFNLTTKRYNYGEIEKIAADPRFITLYATLDDKFGSNGIVSVLIGEIDGRALHIRLWVMSCRVFKRDLELALFDRLVGTCKNKGLETIVGYYFKTEKNGYVENLLGDLGFEKNAGGVWEFNLTADYKCKNQFIELVKDEKK